jgi:NAD(P)-dependent dehydrogenase (short-subunit alcohol dehydrogenase family)
LDERSSEHLPLMERRFSSATSMQKPLNVLAGEVVSLKIGICDVSKRTDIERMVAECAQALGGLDVLVNNAGISGPTATVENMDPDEWEKVMQVDLTGTFNVTRLALASKGCLKGARKLAVRPWSRSRRKLCLSNRSNDWWIPRTLLL